MLHKLLNIALLIPSLLWTSTYADEQLSGRRLAVVVGIDKYRVNGGLGDLAHAGADATSVSEALRTAGFTVIEMTHKAAREPGNEHLAPNRAYIRDMISSILETPNLGRNDTILISLHGHGVHYDEITDVNEEVPRFYFCPADASIKGLQSANDITDRNFLISTDELYKSLGTCKAATRLLIVDACRNDPNRTEEFRSAPLASKTMPKLPPPPGGIAAFFSCKANQMAIEDEDLGHGVFSHFLVRGLSGRADQALEGSPADGIITMSELTTYVANNTYGYVLNKYRGRRKQSPDIRGEFDTNLPLARVSRQRVETKSKIASTVPKMSSDRMENHNKGKLIIPQPRGTKGDWPMWGGSPSRNMVNKTTGVNLDFKLAEDLAYSKNIIWTSTLGSQTYGSPVVADGKVFVCTNNAAEYREKHLGDRGCLLCFNEADGKLLWQLTREKLRQGRVNDWPEQGIGSTPCVEDGLLYVVTNRCELMCLDIEGFHDGGNDGPYQDEVDTEELDADIIWSLDMIEDLGVFPHNASHCSPVIHGDLIFLVTPNGVDEAHLEVPSPRAPCFIAVNRKTGELVWEDNTPALDSKAPAPFNNILHGQWASPAIGEVNGRAQVFMPGGDGVLYAFDALNGELIWWFDMNPKDAAWELRGRGTRNSILATPVFVDNSVILGVGQNPEHGEGVGHLYRIDATMKGDVSPMIAAGDGWAANPNSGQIWAVGGVDTDGSITGEENGLLFRRTISTVAVANGLVYAPDLSGFLHCIDFRTGEKKWGYDTFAAIWGSPMVVDGRVLLGDEDGEMVILKAGPQLEELETKTFNSSIYSTPTFANGRMYVSDRSRLYAIAVQ